VDGSLQAAITICTGYEETHHCLRNLIAAVAADVNAP
jgi:hypothetical protein